MSFWVLVQVFVNLVLLAAVGFLWFRLQRPAKDDPRLSRGLQLLQSKISVLEDLSDRTEHQVGQITALLDQKVREIQTHLLNADKHVQKIESSMGKSLEVAKIFQDKIPHQEIIERQNTIKYVKAARMAHQGVSVEEIAGQVDLSRGEIEFIAKVNREQLQFSEADLPVWAQEGEVTEEPLLEPLVQTPWVEKLANQQQGQQAQQALSSLGNQFRQALQPADIAPAPVLPEVSVATPPAIRPATPNVLKPATPEHPKSVVKKVIFPKVDPTQLG